VLYRHRQTDTVTDTTVVDLARINGVSTRIKFGDTAHSVARPVVCKSIPATVRKADTVSSFKRKLKTHLFCVLIIRNFDISGLPGARSEISGRNIYKISGQLQDIFVGFTRLKTQKMHVFLTS